MLTAQLSYHPRTRIQCGMFDVLRHTTSVVALLAWIESSVKCWIPRIVTVIVKGRRRSRPGLHPLSHPLLSPSSYLVHVIQIARSSRTQRISRAGQVLLRLLNTTAAPVAVTVLYAST
jgi:hypothetical protein